MAFSDYCDFLSLQAESK